MKTWDKGMKGDLFPFYFYFLAPLGLHCQIMDRNQVDDGWNILLDFAIEKLGSPVKSCFLGVV